MTQDAKQREVRAALAEIAEARTNGTRYWRLQDRDRQQDVQSQAVEPPEQSSRIMPSSSVSTDRILTRFG